MTSETIFHHGDHHFLALLNDINEAQYCIDLETYIFNKDPLGEKVVTALIAAADRGVQVRILADGAGTPYWSTGYAKRLEKVGVVTKVFHPFPWQLWNWSRSMVRVPFLLKWFYLL